MAQIGLDHGGRRDRLARRAKRDRFAVAEHQGPFAERNDDIHVVLDQQDRDAAFIARIEDEARDVFLFLLVHPGHRLVEDQQARLGRQRTRELDAFLQSRRHGFDQFVADVLELHEVDDFLDDTAMRRLFARCHRPVEERSDGTRVHVHMAAEQDVVEHAHAAKERQVLEGPRHGLLGDAIRLHAGDVAAV